MKDGVLLVDDPELKKLIEQSMLNYEKRKRKLENKDNEYSTMKMMKLMMEKMMKLMVYCQKVKKLRV